LISGAAPASHFVGGYAGASSERQPPMYFRLGGGTLKGISRPGEIVWSRVFVMDGALHADMLGNAGIFLIFLFHGAGISPESMRHEDAGGINVLGNTGDRIPPQALRGDRGQNARVHVDESVRRCRAEPRAGEEVDELAPLEIQQNKPARVQSDRRREDIPPGFIEPGQVDHDAESFPPMCCGEVLRK